MNLSESIRRAGDVIPAFDWYVKHNPRYDEILFELDKDTEEYKKDETVKESSKQFKKGSHLKIIDPMAENGYVKVMLEEKLGYSYIPISAIRKPLPSSSFFSTFNIAKNLDNFIKSQKSPINIRFKGSSKEYQHISYVSDVKISITNPRANIIFHKNKNNILSKDSVYIGYRPGNKSAPSGFLPRNWNNIYVSRFEFKNFKSFNKDKPVDKASLYKILFGYKANSTERGPHNIQCVATGSSINITPKSNGEYYEIVFKDGLFIHRGNAIAMAGTDKKYEPQFGLDTILSKTPFSKP